ncbi:MAG: T9SS type A sorting domain-containing protein, partial [Candidatus Eisenbacteria bacterium]
SVDHWVSIGGVETTVGGSELAGNDSVLVVGASIPSLGLKAPVVFDGTRWSGLNDRIAGISALDVGGGCLWVGGLFDNVAGIPSRHVARWDEPATAAEVSRLAATRNGDTVRLTWQALGGDEAARLSLERQEGAGAWHHIGPPTFRARESNEYLDPSATADTLRYRIRQVYGRFTDPLFTDPIDAIARGAAITNYSIERRERDAVLWWALQDPEQRARVAVLRSVDGAAPVTLAHDLTGTSGSYADSTAPGTRLEYWLELRSGAQPAVRIGPLTLTALPVRFEIAPNPARGDVLFSMQTPLPGRRTIRIYDAAGRLVATPIDAIEPDGPRVLSWKHSLAAGLYFARASIGGREFTRRIVILN